MRSYSEWINPSCVPEREREKIFRELMSYAMLCPSASVFTLKPDKSYGLTWASPLHWSRQYEWPWAIYHLGIDRYGYVVDVGGCNSVFDYVLADRVNHVVVTDIDKAAIEIGKSESKELRIPNIDYSYWDVREDPPSLWRMDTVTCISVLEHIQDNHVQCIKNMLSIAKSRVFLTLDVKLSGEQEGGSYIDLRNLEKIYTEVGLEMPKNDIVMKATTPGKSGDVLFTVLLTRIEK